MRKILFRGKRFDNGEWIEGNLFIPDLPDTPTEICIGTNIVRITYDVIPETVGQYTGLTDRNGKKLFEGDIVQTKQTGIKGEKIFRFVIKYGEYMPREYCKSIYRENKTIGFYAFDGKRDFQLSTYAEAFEIIGNIHDNPDLMA